MSPRGVFEKGLGPGRRRQVAQAVADHWRTNGYAPSLTEIARAVGLASESSCHFWLARMRAEGLLNYADGLARTVRLTPAGEALAEADA